MLFFLLINVKVPTIVGILTCRSRKYHAQLGLNMIFLITSWPGRGLFNIFCVLVNSFVEQNRTEQLIIIESLLHIYI